MHACWPWVLRPLAITFLQWVASLAAGGLIIRPYADSSGLSYSSIVMNISSCKKKEWTPHSVENNRGVTLENNSSVENNRDGTLENISSTENNSGGTQENDSTVENNRCGTLGNEQVILYANYYKSSLISRCMHLSRFSDILFY